MSLTFLTLMFDLISMFYVQHQGSEWETTHNAVLLSACTVWLQDNFKEPVQRRSKLVKSRLGSQRAELQQLNDVEASNTVREAVHYF